ncbi:MAG: LysR family transcriptional regulator [Alphaproteobacteria bacterium]|nr:LysR family transcriptional regulator [Alphaproteobacteria bacterium]
MDRFRELSTFVAVAEAGAFNAAARRLTLSPSVVTRLVNGLEQRIGARLFTRTTRSVVLTEAGARLLEHAGHILSDLEAAEAVTAGTHQIPRGLLRVTAPVLFGQRYVMPILRDFLDTHPEVTAVTLFVDRVVHLVDEGIDVALRIGALPDSSLSAVRVGTVRRVTVAAPRYLEARGTPRTPMDLADHRIINPSDLNGPQGWPYHARGSVRTARIMPRLTTNSLTAAIDAAVAGWGVTRVLSYQVADALADGRLVEVLRGCDDREMPVQLVHADGRRAPAKTRTFLDFAAIRLRADAARLAAA